MNSEADFLPDLAEIDLVEALIQSRQHIGPKHLIEPGPSREVLLRLLESAAAAPDHEQLRPWRFIVIGTDSRPRLADAFAQALLERDPKVQATQIDDARRKAYRGPVLLLAVVDLRNPNPDVPDAEKLLSLGCAIQNLLLAALVHGFASGLTSGRALSSTSLRQAFGIEEGEQAVCFINLGTASRARPRKLRPSPLDFVSWV